MKRSLTILVCLCFFGISVPALGANSEIATVGYKEEIKLSGNQILVVRQESETSVSVEISYGTEKSLNQKFTFGNTVLITNSLKPIVLDSGGGDPAYLIELPDRTSTYGATTGVVVYKMIWWGIAIVPDDLFEVKDIDGDGASEIIGKRLNKKTFQFSAGAFREK